MNLDSLFTISLFCGLKTIISLVSLSSHTKSLSKNYLWKLLCDRDYTKVYDIVNKDNFLDKYIV